jgi:ComF family protein
MQLALLFGRVLDALFPPRDTERLVRACTEDEFARLLSPRVLPNGTFALLPYRHRLVRAVIREAKFKKNEKALALLAGALFDYLASLEEEAAPFERRKVVILPIPLGNARLRERGYNQVEEIAKRTGYGISHALARTRETLPQTSLSRSEREKNIENAFALIGAMDASVTYILLDDVTTTGATLAAAKAVLLESGFRVDALALAH